MKIIIAAVLITLINLCTSIKMTLFLNSEDGATCFYSQLKQGQKYSVSVSTYSQQKCQLDIYKQNGNSWQSVVSKVIERNFQTISKLSQSQSTYMFCYLNTEKNILKATTQILSGLQLANFQHLPDSNDKDHLQGTIKWVQNMKNKLAETINRLEGTQLNTENLKSSSSKTMLLMAIVGLLVIIGNNVVLYLNAKKQLKDRKLI